MMKVLRSFPAVFLGAILLMMMMMMSGCISRTRPVQAKAAASSRVLNASVDDLVQLVNGQARAIHTVNATIDIATTVGGQKKGKVTDYQEIPGYMLIEKPSDMRLIGLVPVVRTRLFDMVSNGEQFKLSIPPKNKFIEGSSEVTHPSDNSIENIRPQAIMDALLLPYIDPKTDIAVIRSGVEHGEELRDHRKQADLPTYVLAVIKHGEKNWYLSRRIVFGRNDLRPHMQEIFDTEGNVVTQATYENFAEVDGLSFPYLIRIFRPKEEYEINIAIVKLRLNQPLTPDQFQLKQPEGSQLQVLK